MSNLANTRLVLFFTLGWSLKSWDESGMLEREVAIYRRLLPHLGGITFVTYGGAEDQAYVPQLDGIQVLCNRWGIRTDRYARLLPLLHAPHLWRASVFKTNQTSGGRIALRTARLYRKPLIARCGYMLSDFAIRQHGLDSQPARFARQTEAKVFSAADRVVVTTEMMRQVVMRDYAVPPGRIQVIPNYVQTDLFYPQPEMRERQTICFVARLDEQKNPLGLLQALDGLGVHLVMIGDGGLRPQVEALAQELSLEVTFIRQVPHTELPDYFNRATLFILPSFYEGHPKTLLEAMACGLPVIASDIPEIRELIQQRETGYLCGTSAAEIRAAIREVLGDTKLQRHMGRGAREFVVANFSLDRVLEKELALLDSVVNARK